MLDKIIEVFYIILVSPIFLEHIVILIHIASSKVILIVWFNTLSIKKLKLLWLIYFINLINWY